MTRLEMTFCAHSDTENFELIKTHFAHPLLDRPLACVRGKSSGAHQGGFNSFQWTRAVQAVSLLFAGAALSCKTDVTNGGMEAILTGYRGSLAASLDYAISKQPQWLCDMFGVSKDGYPVARRIFLRSNAECKRPGPVALSLNSRFLCPSNVAICNAFGEQLKTRELEVLVRQLCERDDGNKGDPGSLLPKAHHKDLAPQQDTLFEAQAA